MSNYDLRNDRNGLTCFNMPKCMKIEDWRDMYIAQKL